jgi:hypothetical protein
MSPKVSSTDLFFFCGAFGMGFVTYDGGVIDMFYKFQVFLPKINKDQFFGK